MYPSARAAGTGKLITKIAMLAQTHGVPAATRLLALSFLGANQLRGWIF
jgi:hypothetical protein